MLQRAKNTETAQLAATELHAKLEALLPDAFTRFGHEEHRLSRAISLSIALNEYVRAAFRHADWGALLGPWDETCTVEWRYVDPKSTSKPCLVRGDEVLAIFKARAEAWGVLLAWQDRSER